MEMSFKDNLLNRIECLEVARKAFEDDNIKIIDFKLEQLSDDVIGFLGSYFTLQITVKLVNGSVEVGKFFVKTLPTDKRIEEHYQIFRKESKLYKTVLEDLIKFSRTKWRAECYWAREDILVLEDLTQNGYSTLDNDCYDVEHIKSALSALAAMHASSIAFEEKTEQTIPSIYSDLMYEFSIGPNIQWFLVGIKSFQSILLVHPKYQSTEYQNWLKKDFLASLSPIYEMVEPSKKYRNVVCHRDVWGRNILFKKTASSLSAILVDLQHCVYSPPAVDVLFCIYLNCRSVDRNDVFEDCITWYYEKLHNELLIFDLKSQDIIPFESFKESCQEFKLLAITYNCMVVELTRLPKGLLNELRRNHPDKYSDFMMKDRTEVLLTALRNCKQYQEAMFGAVEDLMDMLYENKCF